jgi:acetyl esterase/lipase
VRDSHDLLFDAPPPPADARVEYGNEPLQFGDVRLPDGDGPHPLLVVVHGGYWRAIWNLTHTGHLCRDLAARGIATWNVEYRRAGDPGGGWPGTAEDVGRALAFVPELARRFQLDLDRVALFGHSAGGHLALLNARAIPLRAVFAISAVTDVEATQRRHDGDGAADAFLGDAPAADASPLRRLPLGIRTVLVHGTKDDSVPYEDSVRYAEAAGDEAELVTLEGAAHFEPVDPQSAEWPRVAQLVEETLTLAT